MSTINTNIGSLIAQNALAQNNKALQTSLTRLSTGLRINSGADDPAGLIQANDLKDEQAGINTAIANANKANNVIGTAAGGLTEVSSLLTELQSLISTAANSTGQSSSELAANQSQVDSILDTINRVSTSTSYAGQNLLNGTYGYTTSGTTTTSAFAALQVNSALLADNKTSSVVVAVTSAATAGQLNFTNGTNALTSAATIQVAGDLGTENLSFAGGSKLSAVAAAINNVSSATGVSAVVSGTTVKIDASTYGSHDYVSVAATAGTFATKTIAGTVATKAFGTDAVVTVNGAKATANGKDVSYNNDALDVSFTLSTALNAANATKTFGITGGGASFQFGETVNEGGKASVGIQSVSTSSLGNLNVGFLSSLSSGQANDLSSGNLSQAQTILTTAIDQVSTLSGRLGSFQKYTIGSTIDNLTVAYENASSALSDVQDTDFAAETANLTRAQILASSAETVLATVNSQPQSVLKLLQGA